MNAYLFAVGFFGGAAATAIYRRWRSQAVWLLWTLIFTFVWHQFA